MNATRIPANQLAALREISSPTVANAIETLAIRDRATGYLGGSVRCQFPELGTMVGRAVTASVRDTPGVSHGGVGLIELFEAVRDMPSPSVIVLADASGQPSRLAFAGEVMVTVAQRLGAIAMVTDGALRDVPEARALQFHYFMRYAVVSHAWFDVVDVGTPVTIDGQLIRTGDILHGDVNGITTIPDNAVADVITAAEQITENEKQLISYLRSAEFDFDTFRKKFKYDQ
jgi:regulator of RNase E activity RraA